MKHTVEKTRREYNQWVADETLEDYALRYSPSGFRKWSPLLLANTALGGISFLALEAIGAVLLLNYGFSNAFWAILLASLIIFIAGFPISYYAARYNIDIDLLTRSAGFGYVGSTVTSLIYASFCFIFFALEAAIMAQALKLYFGLPLAWGYLICSLVIIPIVFYGVTAINQLHRWTQPIWLLLMLLPFYFLFQAEPKAFETLIAYQGDINRANTFDWYYFGIATGISFSLIAQIGEQVDYLRFMPDKQKSNRVAWWASLIAAGPGWIVLGCLKQLGGAFLASLVVMTGLGIAEAKEPVQMYLAAYYYVFESPSTALLVTTIFVIISQIKINVTNAYAGSLAWSNFFSRVTHNHPGRVVWLVFNIGIALLLMELGVFDALHKVLGLYSNVAVAWIFAVFADLVINKPLKLSPSIVEFKRAHLYDFNPVGFVSMLVASFVSILAFSGLFGEYAQAYSWLFALLISLILSPLIAIATKGKYYIARDNEHFVSSDGLVVCGVCEQHYAETDMAHCPFHEVAICSLCCTLESNCRDQCKPAAESIYHQLLKQFFNCLFKQSVSDNIIRRISNFITVSVSLLSLIGLAFWLVYADMLGRYDAALLSEQLSYLYILFGYITVLVCTASWWIILANESRLLAETELNEQNEILDQEIKERKQAEERIQQLAYYDPLTNLPNRRHLQDQIEQSIARSNRNLSQFAVLMLDLDHFKAVNDTLGHLAGDELLQHVAQRILAEMRETDVIARLGGDEFMVVLESFEHIEDVGRIAEKLVKGLSVPFVLEQSNDVRIGASIGICIYPEHGKSVEQLMDHSDMALYLAKDNGRGCFAYFTEALTKIARERLQLEAKLRTAIENQELRVFYQPQVDIETGKIVGAEALVRWQDPDNGLVFPDQFIPIAEETGLIIPLGEWVLRETCRQGKQWLDQGLPKMTLAVNVSPRQFDETNLVELVTQVLDETNFPAEFLELEVTEGTLMQNQDQAVEVLNQLRRLGVRFAMDDFGTGYSSLAYLKRFPLDMLKIDKSFIDDIPYDESDMEITATILSMGKNLKINVLAEGVETAEQLDFLKKKGCAKYQGYYKSKPVNTEAFVALLTYGIEKSN